MSNQILYPRAVILSDLHIGDPRNGRLDDFNRDEDFQRLLSEVIPKRAGWPATLILNGDFIDFPQVLPELGRHPYGDTFGATEVESLQKMARVIEGHPEVFKALTRYLERGGQVVVLAGNHDIDLHWPSVFEALRVAVGGAKHPKLCFVRQGFIQERGIYIEHGNQYSFDNQFEHWENPIVEAPDRPRLERPWGTLFMDLVYNDLEELYPFVNKVHPHSTLAWIALRSFRDSENVSPKVLARLAAFFLRKGKRFAWGRLLGKEETLSPESIQDFVDRLGEGGSRERLQAIVSETAALVDAGALPESLPELGAEGLLGRDDDRGLRQRQHELLTSGQVSLVVFGHTHVPVDGSTQPPWGTDDPRRGFNTGSWMPSIPIGTNESPRWQELKARSPIHDVRYLIIDLTNPPRAWLEPVLPPDRN